MESFVQLFIGLGLGGLLSGVNAYTIWYLLSDYIPKQNILNREELREARKEFLGCIDKNQTNFLDALSQQRTESHGFMTDLAQEMRLIKDSLKFICNERKS